uniref:Rho-GAP domain-containing protein n=1 Tax=viral metagenome TaxID=1070528 RepID=A0A6C0M4B5_9ZZZZ
MSTPDQQIANLQKLLKNIPDSDTEYEYISAIIQQIDNIRRREQTDQQIANLQKLLKNIPDSDTEYISAIIQQIDNNRRRNQIGGKKKSRRNQSRHWNQSKRRKSNKKN